MILLLTYLLWWLTGLYVVLVLLVVIGTFRLRPAAGHGNPRLSVVVAARNEETHIARCVEALAAQDYPAGRYEIIVINDRSEDRTAELLEKYRRRIGNLKVVTITRNDSAMPHKKHALTQGIAGATGEIILLTDADCVVPPGWARGMARYFDERTGVVAGYSYFPFAGEGVRKKLFSVQVAAMELINAGVIGLGGAFSCTGRNFGYRRAVYDRVGGYAKISHSVSGDDDLFLQLVARETDWKIAYAADPKTFVLSYPPERMREYSRQQKRHISAARYYPQGYLLLSALVYLYMVTLVLGLAAALGGGMPWAGWVTAAAVKLGGEWVAAWRAGTLFGAWSLVLLAPLISLLFPLYILYFSAAGLVTPVTWKGQAG